MHNLVRSLSLFLIYCYYFDLLVVQFKLLLFLNVSQMWVVIFQQFLVALNYNEQGTGYLELVPGRLPLGAVQQRPALLHVDDEVARHAPPLRVHADAVIYVVLLFKNTFSLVTKLFTSPEFDNLSEIRNFNSPKLPLVDLS